MALLSNQSLFPPQQIFPFVAEAVGAHSVFFFFGGVSLMCSVLSYIILPETKGKSLEQIQEYFEKKTLKPSQGKNENKVSEEDGKICNTFDKTPISSIPTVNSSAVEKVTWMIMQEDATKL